MLTNKNGPALFKKGLGKRLKEIGLFVEYTQCAGVKHFMRDYSNYYINTTMLFLDIYM